MTEAEWLACTDPSRMLGFLRGRASDRQLRLFVVAGFRLSPSDSERVRALFDVAARFADGEVGLAELRKSWGAPASPEHLPWPERPFEWAAGFAGSSRDNNPGYPPAARLVPIVRDIFGNPFRPAATDPAWLTPTVVQLAQGIYADEAFDRLPILADALQDAGCENEDVLAHCRGDSPHVRGCRVVDLLLGKV